ncbi:MAG: ATP-binding protein [Betaproteobacteria bacterium]
MGESSTPLEIAELTIRSRMDELPRVTALLDELGERHALPPAAISMHLVLDEIVSNIVKYAYDDDAIHAIRIALEITRDTIKAEVDDDGRAFDPLSVAEGDTPRSLSDLEIGGEGIRLVRRLMSEVHYARIGGHNRLTLIKRFS